MIHRRPDREPGPGHPPATRNASHERSEAQQPAGHPGLTAFGRPVSTACASDTPVPQTGEGSALPDNQDTIDTPGLAQNLPALVLEKIFSYLPSHALSQCARVCRHWHACLPALEPRIALWLQENPQPWLANLQLGRGFSSRTQPFLQDGNSPFLYPLMKLRQEQQEQRSAAVRQDTTQGGQPSTACDLQSSLVHAALHRQLSLAPELRLRPIPLAWPADSTPTPTTAPFAFSPCSRWLSVTCECPTGPSSHLRLYGWENGAWKQCQLVPEPVQPVHHIRFTATPADTLIGVHGTDVLAWSKEQDNDTWHSALVCRIPPPGRILNLASMANGDQVMLTLPSPEERTLSLLFCRRTGDGRSWTTAMTATHGFEEGDVMTRDYYWAADPQSCQLALKTTRQLEDSGHFITELDIWHTGLDSSRPAPWKSQHAVLPWHHVHLAKITYSPGGQFLLGVLSDGQACLWKLDAQYRLQEQLVVPHCHYHRARDLKQQVAFRSDGKQLAFSRSPQQVQLLYCNADGRWQYGPLLEAPPVPDSPAHGGLRYMQLSARGTILARKTDYRVDIWHQDPAEGWQHRVRYQWEPGHGYIPQFCFLLPCELVCISAEDPELSLQIHGPDPLGRLVRKACMPVRQCIDGAAAASPDGLSLLLGSTKILDIPMQLVAAQEGDGHQCRLP